MQRTVLILVYFLFYAKGFSQQYPFVHYTPKDGLISNSIRTIYQDSKGRLYFTSMNGLSVYDGARFSNYTSANGLDNDIVNYVMEMGDDSIWVVTNNRKIQCLMNGKMKTLVFEELPPIINNLTLDEKPRPDDPLRRGNLYAASEEGLYRYHENKFVKLPFVDLNGQDRSTFIGNIIPAGNYLLVARDNFLIDRKERFILYLYDPEQKKIIAQTQNDVIFLVAKAPDGRIWVSTGKNILSLDTTELRTGKLVLQELPAPFAELRNERLAYISFDQYGNFWMTDRASVLKKITSNGKVTSFTKTSGLNILDIGNIFLDKEGTTWIPSFKTGVDKLVHNNFSFIPDPFDLNAATYISYAAYKDQMLLFSGTQSAAVGKGPGDRIRRFEIKNANLLSYIIETPRGIFGTSDHTIYKLVASGNILYPQAIFVDTIDNLMGNPMIDKNGNLLLCGKDYLTAVVEGKIISRQKINYYTDQVVMDTSGNICTVTRAGELSLFKTNPGLPEKYLEKKFSFTKELTGINPRSLIIDRNNLFLIGSRSSGIYAFRIINGALIKQFHLTAAMGLSDNFISFLAVDQDNNIWACSPSGLDKIIIKSGIPVIENITRQNNIYQSVSKVIIDKSNTAWALLSNGLIKITPENKQPVYYSPSLMVSMLKAGQDTISEKASATLTYKQNNLSFYFAATSFLDEKQVQYSYRLLGGSNTQWSGPSNNATVSFIDLHPGDYTLEVKAAFPASRYPEQTIQYNFSITPPWWQTWWFRISTGIFIIGLLIIGTRFYYRGKLEKKLAASERQQAIEKERTRIATDMHDDLGAGLSRIRFLSEKVKRNTFSEVTKTDVEKMQLTSNELMEKMNEIIWAMSEKNDTLEDLLFYTRSYAKEYCEENNLACSICLPENVPSFFVRGEIRRNIFLTVKESLHNIVKHAGAGKVVIDVAVNNDLEITISDDGKGFTPLRITAGGIGIRNMQKRMVSIGGSIDINNGQGVTVKMKVPL